MKFEDLLKPSKAQENYVMAPESEVPNKLQQFFAERTLEPKQEPATPESSVLSEQKKEAIKSVFKPPQQPVYENDGVDALLSKQTEQATKTQEPYIPDQTDMYAQYAQQTQPVAASDLIDMEKISSQVDSAMPEKSWADYIKYLAPLATEAVLGKGQTFVSGGIASKMMKEDLAKDEARRKSLEEKLMEIQKARQLAAAKAAGRGLKTLEVDVNGKPIIMRAEEALGKQAWKKPETDGFAQKVALEKLKANLRMKVAAGKATEAERKELRKIEMDLAQKWSTDPFTRDTRTVTDAYNKISKIDPYSKDPIKDIAVIFDFMKTLDPNSVVRESEQSLVMGARSAGEIIDNLSEVLTGERKLTPDQIKNIQKFASLNYQRRLESQKAMIDSDFTKRALSYGLDPDKVVGQLSLGVPLLWTNPKTGKTRVITADPAEVNELLKVPGVTKVQ